jgi:hypothetical protein
MAQNRNRERNRQENSTLQKANNSIADLVRNEGNGYLVADSNRMMINMSNELSDVCKEMLNKEHKNELIEILMEELQEKH